MEGIDPVLWRYFLHIIGPVARNVPMLGVPGNHDLSLKRKGKAVIGKKAYETHVNYPDPKVYYGVHVHGIHVLALQFKDTPQMDEIRFGSTSADVLPVIPEPGSAVLLGLGAVLGLTVRRRRL